MKRKEAACPSCGARLEFEPGQDGSCDWYCPKCGWHQHLPPAATHTTAKRLPHLPQK
jgi:ribosomal protein L37AE/L43A